MLSDVMDLQRYPINALDEVAGRALVERCRQEFSQSVLLELPGFITLDAVGDALSSVKRARHPGHCYQMMRSAYDVDDAPPGVPNDPLTDDDPRTQLHRRCQRFLGGDELPADSSLRQLFASDAFTTFLQTVLDEPLYPVVDPVMDICIAISSSGDEIGWHFDSHRYSVTVLLQEPDAGGTFEYLRAARQGQQNFDHVPAVFAGDYGAVSRAKFKTGSLMLFRGIDTLHRLTPIRGDLPRILGLLSYDATPNRVFSDEFHVAVLGRTQ